MKAEAELERIRAEIQHHIDLLESAAECYSDEADKAEIYSKVAKNLRKILDKE